MKVEKLESWPKNCNPFEHDVFSMGTHIGSNITILHMNHNNEECKELVLVNLKTGERIKVKI
jgi:hypothetical protein